MGLAQETLPRQVGLGSLAGDCLGKSSQVRNAVSAAGRSPGATGAGRGEGGSQAGLAPSRCCRSVCAVHQGLTAREQAVGSITECFRL